MQRPWRFPTDLQPPVRPASESHRHGGAPLKPCTRFLSFPPDELCAIDSIIEHANEPISKGFIKELHRIIKNGTKDSAKEWFAVGDYKQLPNEAGGRKTTEPECVDKEIKALLREYKPGARHNLDDIICFHVAFERTHPFQDVNGRVGRLIMFKECLSNDVVPFIITDKMKAFYYRGLTQWDYEKGYLTDTYLAAQDRFKTMLDYFRIPYK